MQKLIALAALGLVVAVMANPAPTDARPGPKPHPRPSATPTPTPTPTPASGFVNGIDVSYHQGSVAWGSVAASGKRFAYVRASAGTLTSDQAYATNRAGAQAAGLRAVLVDRWGTAPDPPPVPTIGSLAVLPGLVQSLG